ncbi:MAG: DUF4405 domain-containing protein [Slackia sp.]|nr:DUF4405 domain-containing protein [Slackia sp.]
MSAKSLIFDIVLAVCAVALMFPGLTGYGVHEWAGFVFAAAVLVHVTARHDEGVRLFKSGCQKRRAGRAFSFALNVAIFVDLAVCAVSGLMVSGAVLPAFGLYAAGFFFWAPVHAFSAQLFVALALVHVVLFAPKMKAALSRR